ncbi:hypothetical protein L1887_39263 [Cichorium endivia]|nr:hypothetical protein L1887_39263 [Cichorium endivia]
MPLLFLFLLLSSPLIYLLSKIIKNRSRFSPPGPVGLPIIGNLHQINRSSLHTSLWQLSKSYGPIVSLNLGFIPTIVVSSASLAKEVLKTQDIIFCSRPSFVGTNKLSYNDLDVAFSPYNEYWREMKKNFMIHLLGSKKVESFRYIREDEVSRAMKNIHELTLSSKPVNLNELMKSVTSTIITRVAFGKRYEDGHERNQVLRFINEAQAIMGEFFVSDIWSTLPFIGLVDRLLGKMDRLDKCFHYFDVFYQELIDEHLNSRKFKSHEEEKDFIDILLRLKEDELVNLTYDHIKGLLMNVLVAGTDTSAATVVWAMTALIKNPKVMKRAQEEVRNVVGKKGRVDEDDLPKLTYLKAVAKTVVFVNALAIGKDPESWESPEEFLPERFLGSDIDFKGNDLELIPFGAGRRICPGISLGVATVDLLLANLVYLFDWGLPNGMTKEDIDFDAMPGITMHKRNDLCLLAHAHF